MNTSSETDENDSALFERIEALITSNRSEEASKVLNEFVAQNPNHARALSTLGGVSLSLGNIEDAEKHLERAIGLDNKLADTHYNLARLCKTQERDFHAPLHLDDALEIDPHHAGALAMRGQAAMDDGDYDAAIDDFSSLLDCDSKNSFALQMRALARLRNCKYQLALDDLDQADSLSGPASWIEDCRGCVYFAMEHFEEACGRFRAALGLIANDNVHDQCSYRIHLSSALTAVSRNEEALEQLNEACELDPQCPQAFHSRGILLERLGREFDALRDIDRVEELVGTDDFEDEFGNYNRRRLRLESKLRVSKIALPIGDALQQWLQGGGLLPSLITYDSPKYIESEAEVLQLAAAFEALATQGPIGKLDPASLNELITVAQMIPDDDAASACHQHCLPIVAGIVEQAFSGIEWPPECILESLRLLACRSNYPEHQSLITKAVQEDYQSTSSSWVSILSPLVNDATHESQLLSQLTTAPQGIIGAMLLNGCNLRCEDAPTKKHLFDSERGVQVLTQLLEESDEGDFWLTAVAAATSYLSPAQAEQLATIASKHKNMNVRVVAAWALAKRGDQEQVGRLCEYAMDFRCADQALGCLDELGMSEHVAAEALTNESRAKAAFANWLVHPNELGMYPDAIETYDHRTLYWPPTDDTREVWLFRYSFDGEKNIESDVGMVGSVTFVLFGEQFDGKPASEIYAKHCAWELRQKGLPESKAAALFERNPSLLD